jgi:hypothetical protein
MKYSKFMMFLFKFSKTNELYYKWIKLCLWIKFIVYDGPYENLMIDKALFMDQINYIDELWQYGSNWTSKLKPTHKGKTYGW